jgi:hypothetical protein
MINLVLHEDSLGLLVAGSCGYYGYLQPDGSFLPYDSIQAIKARHENPGLKEMNGEEKHE